jgi:hypothetical protein
VIAAVFTALIVTSCDFFNPNDPPHPVWGVWAGEYPDVISSVPDSARWVFTSDQVYLFYALKSGGGLLTREIGYYAATGMLLILSADRAGEVEREELQWEATENDLTVFINGIPYQFRRTGSPEAADAFRDLLVKQSQSNTPHLSIGHR